MSKNDMMDLFLMMDEGNRPGAREKFQKAPVNYMGSKYDSLGYILELLPNRAKWIDVFGGSGVVTLNRAPSPLEVYNDKWSGIVALYKCVQDPKKLQELTDKIRLAPHAREFFLWCKETEGDEINDDVMRAFKTYYMIQSSFAGRAAFFGRVVKGTSNIWRKIQENIKYFPQIADRLKKVQIENLSWDVCLKDFDDYDSVFYMDPPYFESNIYKNSFSREDHILMCNAIFRTKGFVALSGYENDIYDKYKWSSVHSWTVSTDVASMATTEGATREGQENIERKARKEFLWIKEAE